MKVRSFIRRNAAILACGSVTTVFIMHYFTKPNLLHQIDDVRSRVKPKFDSMTDKLTRESRFIDTVTVLINMQNINSANKLIDSARKVKPDNSNFLVLKGMVYFAEGRNEEAIKWYNKAMQVDRAEFPNTLAKRAEVFIKLNEFDKGIADYKNASKINYDFQLNVALAYDRIGLRDSAEVYYQKYLDKYPDDSAVSNRIQELIK
jgi:tetratricopeptide (TPR) repeat protein